MASNTYRISVRRGPEEGQSYPLDANSITVGRDPMAEIVFSDPEVSRQHARFTRTNGGYQLQDLGSTNGTFIDGKRLGGEIVPLQPGAVITMGSNVTLIYEAMPDPMATVISPDFSMDFAEEEEEADELRTMLEAPESDDFPAFDDAYQEDVEDDEATAFEYGTAGAAATSELADEADDFSFGYEEAEEAPDAYAADDRTMLDMSASDLPSYGASAEEDDDALPSFDDSSDLPSFDDEPVYTPPKSFEEGRMAPPPPPPSAPIKQEDPNRRRNMIIAVVVILLLCCCCSIFATYFWLGDILLQYTQF